MADDQQETQPEATETGAAAHNLDLPDDHPLVRTLAANKEQIRALRERTRRLDEIEDAQKSESEKAAERVTQAEQRAIEAEARATRRDVALEHGLTKDDAALLDTITDEDAMRRLAGRLAKQARDDAAPRTPKPHPAQRDGDAPADDKDATARAFFGFSS